MAEWFEGGLAFQCTRCGDCCRGEPGYVWVTFDEVAAMANALGIGAREFEASCLRQVGRRMSLLEKPNGDCIFWEDSKGCIVYTARPLQCRTFPFWPENIRSREEWQSLASRCPGIGRGRTFSAKHIRETADRHK
jgi:Fe-S-cluster containining protein